MKTVESMRSAILQEPLSDDLIQDLLPDSTSAYMLLAGRSGIGKTFILLNILYCLASGRPFLSRKTKQCKVGYLSLEGDSRKILKRFDVIGESFPEASGNIYWEHTLPFKLDDAGVVKLMELVTGLDVVGIDPLRPMVAGDYTTPKDASTFLLNLRKVQNETGTTIILTHHIRKPDKRVKVQPEDLLFEIKGASEYVEAANSVLLLERASQPKDSSNRFAPSSDSKALHFVKIKDAPAEPKPTIMSFNDGLMLFQPQLDFSGDAEAKS